MLPIKLLVLVIIFTLLVDAHLHFTFLLFGLHNAILLLPVGYSASVLSVSGIGLET